MIIIINNNTSKVNIIAANTITYKIQPELRNNIFTESS